MPQTPGIRGPRGARGYNVGVSGARWAPFESAMITAPSPVAQPTRRPARAPARWQTLWGEPVRDPRELLELVGLPGLAPRVSAAAARQFPLRVPRGFVARMRHGDPADP